MRVIISLSFMALAIGLALWRGGTPERLFAAILAAMVGFDRVGHMVLGEHDRAAIDALHLTIDLTSFIAMMAVMIYARRLWPIWACSFQLLSLASYPLLLLDTQLPSVVRTMLAVAPSYFISALLILGVVLHRVRLKRHGSDPSWRSFSRPAISRMRRRMPKGF